MIIGGCDPGLDGAFALVEDEHVIATLPVPTIKGKTKGRQIDETLLEAQFAELYLYDPAHFFIEAVHAMPHQGSASMFKFGDCFGFQRGLIVGNRIARTYIAPVTWKRALGLGANKEAALDRAGQLFPDDVKLFRAERGVRTAAQAIGVAEACLIGWWGTKHVFAHGLNK